MRMSIKAVLFDFDHTLGVDDRLEERVLRLLAERHCVHDPSDAEIAEALRSFRSGELGLAAMLSQTFTRWGYDGDVESEYKMETLRMLPESLTPMPGAGETLEGLAREGFSVGILTNGWTELQRAKAALIGFEGPVFASEEIGAWKPDRRAFHIAVSQLEVDAAESLYVGDSPYVDVAGAKNAGMRAAWADLEGKRYPPDVVEPDLVVKRLTELIDAVLKPL
jgi:HAD superfamily hydrolase (TIGR01509 family)